jgi:hypothetical protein
MVRAIQFLGVVAAGMLICGIAACSSDSVTEATSSKSGSSSKVTAPATEPPAPVASPPPAGLPPEVAPPPAPVGHQYTIVDFIRDNGIVESELHPADAGAPVIELPTPTGWSDAGRATPAWAWNVIYFTDPAMSADPPNIVTLVSKLTGNGANRVLTYAPGETGNMTEFDGPPGTAIKVGEFNAWQRAGTFTRKDGVRRAIVQTTVLFPAPDGVYIMQHNADGPPEQLGLLSDTVRIINEQTTITP